MTAWNPTLMAPREKAFADNAFLFAHISLIFQGVFYIREKKKRERRKNHQPIMAQRAWAGGSISRNTLRFIAFLDWSFYNNEIKAKNKAHRVSPSRSFLPPVHVAGGLTRNPDRIPYHQVRAALPSSRPFSP